LNETPYQEKYFDQIMEGEKVTEFRDAHLTFICEETGEILRMNVENVFKMNTEDLNINPEEKKDLFEDETVIGFVLVCVEKDKEETF